MFANFSVNAIPDFFIASLKRAMIGGAPDQRAQNHGRTNGCQVLTANHVSGVAKNL